MRCKMLLLVVALGLFALAGSAAQAQVPDPYPEGTPQADVNTIVSNTLRTIDGSSGGMHQYFNDDLVGNLFSGIGAWLGENVAIPFWNGLMEKNPVCIIIAVVLAGFLLRGGAKLFDALAKAGQQTSTPAGQK